MQGICHRVNCTFIHQGPGAQAPPVRQQAQPQASPPADPLADARNRIALLESRLQAQVLLNSSAAAAAQDANPEQEN